jgi:hypothetical protein
VAGVETLALLCGGVARFGSVRGAAAEGQLSRSELAGLLAGLSREQMLFALAKYCGDEKSLRELWAHVYSYAAGLAGRQKWKIVRGKPIVSEMSRMAVYEVVSPGRCSKCRGTGLLVNRACTSCSGTGFVRVSGRKLAECAGVDERRWRECWKDRYEQIVKYVQGIDSAVNVMLRRADIDGNIEFTIHSRFATAAF